VENGLYIMQERGKDYIDVYLRINVDNNRQAVAVIQRLKRERKLTQHFINSIKNAKGQGELAL
jgi:hypothetical protein